jgi:hypothetical protein
MKLRVATIALLFAANTAVTAGELDISLSNDTAQVRYYAPMSHSKYGHTDFDVGALYTENDDLMASAGMMMSGDAGSRAPGVHLGVGFRGYGVSFDNINKDLFALTLGGEVLVVPPSERRLGIAFFGNFAPDITTFGDAGQFSEVGGRVQYEVLPEASVYVGYRQIKADLDPGATVTLDKGLHVGLKMKF